MSIEMVGSLFFFISVCILSLMWKGHRPKTLEYLKDEPISHMAQNGTLIMHARKGQMEQCLHNKTMARMLSTIIEKSGALGISTGKPGKARKSQEKPSLRLFVSKCVR